MIFQEKLKTHIFMLESPRISMLLQCSYVTGGHMNWHNLYGGQFGIANANSKGLSPWTQQSHFQKYIAWTQLCAHM